VTGSDSTDLSRHHSALNDSGTQTAKSPPGHATTSQDSPGPPIATPSCQHSESASHPL